MTQNWYNTERVGQPGSVVLTKWKAEREAQRVKNTTQYVTSSNPAVIELFGNVPASSGYAVTDDTAMRVSAVAACIQLIGGTIASLPLSVYERTVDGRKKIDSPLWYLLNEQPCGAWTAASMFEWWIRCNALRGDAFALIQRDRFGEITGIVPVHPDRMTPITDGIGGILYRYQPRTGNPRTYQDNEILHIPGFGYDGDSGRSLSVIKHGALQSIGIALAADDFSGKFFANGGSPKHLIRADGKLEEDTIERLRTAYAERYTGPENVGKPMVLTQGLDIKELSMSAVDAELLNSRKYQVIDIARAFGVPPFMIGANDTTTSWGTGIEQMTLGFVKFTLQTYLNRIEQEINRKFFATEQFFVEFNLDGLLRGDSKSEGEYLRQARGGSQGPGWLKLDEVRRIKNLPPVGPENGGDVIYEPKGKDNAQAPAATTA
ncbi:phage portal protein, HK97 family [Nitrosospira sp. Nsp11]|uniref:phage portal protein n=1 Tax=Nitrosospira sp. Nsp11 TaxID=1855338 RepID=UPI00091C19D0|nr:phage portal protein [Nitrosospira sp. Nsp11]SHL10611.1 phage portal protein, HK97 family [Nitrosospira sp. Nsp11]